MALNVFLDTSVFVRHHFLFNKFKLKKISDLAASGCINVYTTDIVKNEILKNLKEETENTRQAINAVFDKGQLLNIFAEYESIKTFFKGLKSDIFDKAVLKYQEFLNNSKTRTIKYDNVNPTIVFEKYFSSSPPFGHSKKKHEFPDAFSLQALLDWCLETGEEMYIIGGDGDWEKACQECESFTFVPDIPQFLEIYTELITEETNFNFALEVFKANRSMIIDKIITDIPSVEIQSDQYFEYSDEISEVSVEDVEIISWELTAANDTRAEFDLVVRTDIKAKHDMKNPHTAVHLGSGNYWYLEGVTFTQTHINNISLSVTLDYPLDKDGAPPEISVIIEESIIELETDLDADDVEVEDRWLLEDRIIEQRERNSDV